GRLLEGHHRHLEAGRDLEALWLEGNRCVGGLEYQVMVLLLLAEARSPLEHSAGIRDLEGELLEAGLLAGVDPALLLEGSRKRWRRTCDRRRAWRGCVGHRRRARSQ